MAKPAPHKAHLELAREFYFRCQSREVDGLATYGEFDPATDKRCLSEELSEELLDAGNYLTFLERKRPDLSFMVQTMRAKIIVMYGKAKKLKELELTRGK